MSCRIACLLMVAALASINALDVPEDDYTALMAIYNSCGGSAWDFGLPNPGWGEPKESATVGNWEGVSVSNGRVSELDLRRLNMVGVLPTEMGLLTRLRQFNALENDIRGSIPASIGNIRALRVLQISGNNLSGSIPPEIADCTNIKEIRLANNRLTGELPSRLGELQKMTDLFLENNRLSGTLPPELANCARLKVVRLFNNRFSGSIPSAWGNFPVIEQLLLHENQLTGSIPPELGMNSTMSWLKLDDNQLSGPLPAGLQQASNLHALTITGNAGINGEIPGTWTSWTKLDVFYLVGTSLTVPSPGALYDWVDDRASIGWADGLLQPASRTIRLRITDRNGPLLDVTIVRSPSGQEYEIGQEGVAITDLNPQTTYSFEFLSPPSSVN